MIYKSPFVMLATMILGLPLAIGDNVAVEVSVGLSPQILNFPTTRGWLFIANSDMTITEFGLWDENADGFSAVHRLNVWTDTGTQIGQIFIDNSSVLDGPTVAGGQFRYSLGVPVNLSAGNRYVISADMTGDLFINDGVTNIANPPELTWLEDRFGDGVVPVFPTNSVGTNAYFGPNFKFTTAPEPVVIDPDSVTVTHGVYAAGDVTSLAASDNSDLVVQRLGADVQSRTEFRVKAISPVASPTLFEVTLEGSVFARSPVYQTIELLSRDEGGVQIWEQIDTRAATQFTDSTVTVVLNPATNLSRFIDPLTFCIEARVRYQSVNPRQQFSSNTDQIIWTIGQ